MNFKYIRLFNKQTENLSDYIQIKEDENNFHCILPVTYFWLEKLGKLELSSNITTEYSKIFFDFISDVPITDSHKRKYQQTYGYYYDLLEIEEKQLKRMDDVGRFIEFFAHQNPKSNIVDRLERCIFVYHLKNNEYVETLGPVIGQLFNNEKELDEVIKFKALLSNTIEPFIEYIDGK